MPVYAFTRRRRYEAHELRYALFSPPLVDAMPRCAMRFFFAMITSPPLAAAAPRYVVCHDAAVCPYAADD